MKRLCCVLTAFAILGMPMTGLATDAPKVDIAAKKAEMEKLQIAAGQRQAELGQAAALTRAARAELQLIQNRLHELEAEIKKAEAKKEVEPGVPPLKTEAKK